MSQSSSIGVVAAGLLIAAGTATGGWFIGDGFYEGRKTTRYVTVKGLSERVVRADMAEWPLQISSASNDLSTAQRQIESDLNGVIVFLTDAGLPAADIIRQRLQVVDQLAERYNNANIRDNRYIITQTILVRSDQVDLVQTLSRRTSELVKNGIVIQDNMGPTFTFTQLSGIKPEMVAEATKDARASAERFAEDSDSEVGSILKASQGYFSINPLIQSNPYASGNEQIDKKVRVVTTIDFSLED